MTEHLSLVTPEWVREIFDTYNLEYQTTDKGFNLCVASSSDDEPITLDLVLCETGVSIRGTTRTIPVFSTGLFSTALILVNNYNSRRKFATLLATSVPPEHFILTAEVQAPAQPGLTPTQFVTWLQVAADAAAAALVSAQSELSAADSGFLLK